jgi:hypothetical protein
MQFNLVFDQFENNYPYPNLAKYVDTSPGDQALWCAYPFVVQSRLLKFCQTHDFPVQFWHIDQQFPIDSWYMIAFAYYHFDIDYFNILPNHVKLLLRERKIKLLFYYHEGDNPANIQQDLMTKCVRNQFDKQCWRLISANSAADVCFNDHELFYWQANARHPALPWNPESKQQEFTALTRVHKWWRATAMVDLHRVGVLANSYWSYGGVDNNDQFDDNPIEIDSVDGLRQQVCDFLEYIPYSCDALTLDDQNRHGTLVPEHFNNSYIHLVLETFFDADQSGGSFLTEKTFKPIKHAQPFVLIAPPGSLQLLRDLGYKTFDAVIDPSYDTIVNNTQRWQCIRELLLQIQSQGVDKISRACADDVIHNQQHFLSTKFDRIYQLYRNLHEPSQ